LAAKVRKKVEYINAFRKILCKQGILLVKRAQNSDGVISYILNHNLWVVSFFYCIFAAWKKESSDKL